MRGKKTLAFDFLREQAARNEKGCFYWPFSRSSSGYGQFTHRGKRLQAHREMCRIVHGEPQREKDIVRHLCGYGHLGCINPNHLVWGTIKQNGEDMVRHGRANGRKRKQVVCRRCKSDISRPDKFLCEDCRSDIGLSCQFDYEVRS